MTDQLNVISNKLMMAMAFQSTIERVSFDIKNILLFMLFGFYTIYQDKINTFLSSFQYTRHIYRSNILFNDINNYMNYYITNNKKHFSQLTYILDNTKLSNEEEIYKMHFTSKAVYNIDNIDIYIAGNNEFNPNENNKTSNSNIIYDNSTKLILKSYNIHDIENFIKKVINHKNKLINDNISLYYMYPIIDSDSDGNMFIKCNPHYQHINIMWNMNTLSSIKNFDKLFLKNKNNILNIIDNFKNKENVYKYVEYKLGFMLYGPPGTGKTSFIKSLAKYLKRNVVNIPIECITSNSLLLDVLTNNSFYNKYDTCFTKDINTNIYVIEDIDRINCALKHEFQTTKIENETKIDNYILSNINSKSNIHKNVLNLSGILNAIDGVVEMPGRIIIFTANHPEKLDPALTRPGRIDHIIKFDYLEKEQFIEMLTYFKVKIDTEKIDHLFSLNPKITGADLENCYTKYFDDSEKIVTEFLNKYSPIIENYE